MKPSEIAARCRAAFTAGTKVQLSFPNCFNPVGNFPKGIEQVVTPTETTYLFEPDEMLAWLFDNGAIELEEAVLTPPRSFYEVAPQPSPA
jgi:hypothetical protein